ncbi:MAG: hypothetical protein A2Y65_09180 [Deltaproteobacteria bacterium RBG_13_52_11]|nr:MAG: hypothetical protein A2Y65_09180 [Deltaproteobacteria bacterium RBG_13_52_11]
MEVGDKITFSFGKGEKEGIVYKIFPKTVYIKVDFSKHKGKIIKRPIAEVHPEEAARKKEAKKKKEEKKQRAAKEKEDRKREKAAKKSTA